MQRTARQIMEDRRSFHSSTPRLLDAAFNADFIANTSSEIFEGLCAEINVRGDREHFWYNLEMAAGEISEPDLKAVAEYLTVFFKKLNLKPGQRHLRLEMLAQPSQRESMFA